MRAKRAREPHNTPTETTGTLYAFLEQALEHYGDAAWLGDNSPLASPYLLGEALARLPDADTAIGRGRALQRVISSAVQQLDGKGDARFAPANLLQLTYLRTSATRNQAGVATELALSPATYYRHRQDAISQLERVMLGMLHPAVKIERPASQRLVGRQALIADCVRELRAAQVVALTGPAGVGKTTLGAHVAGQADTSGAFWYTLRPKLNVNTSSFAFALGLYLRERGSPLLWLQLMADRGKTDIALILNLARKSLSEVGAKAESPLILCVDEADVARSSPIEDESSGQLRSLIEDIVSPPRQGFAALLMGQQLLFEPDAHHRLAGLDADEVRALLDQADIALDDGLEVRLREYSAGNPLTIKLLIGLHKAGDPLPSTLRDVAATPSLSLLLDRVQRHLNVYEKLLLQSLSVYSSPCPRDAWRDDATTLEGLIGRGVVVEDAIGGVALHPVLRELISRRMNAEDRARFHLAAAGVFAARAQYTVAARHFKEAGHPEIAVSTWYQHREGEIAQGQATSALALFRELPRDALPATEKKQVALIRAELHGLVGDTQAGVDELESVRWLAKDSETPHAMELMGVFKTMQGQIDAALNSYQAGLDATSAQLQEKQARLLALRAAAQIRERDLRAAAVTASQLRHTADIVQGDLDVQHADYQAAREHFLRALDTARELGDAQSEAATHFRLGSLAVRSEDTPMAIAHFEAAVSFYRRVGDAVRSERTRSNLAVLHLQTGNYEQALAEASTSFAFFEQLGQPYWTGLNAANIAEAYFFLGQMDEAELFALRALREEELGARSYALCTLGQVQRVRHKPADSERYLREAIAAAQEAQDKWAEAPAWRALGLTLRARDDVAAQDAFGKALALFAEMKLPKEVARTEAMAGESSHKQA